MSVSNNQTTRSKSHVAKQALSCSTNFVRRLTERKQIESLEAECHIVNQLRPNVLNLVQLIAIGLGGTIGIGIFGLSGKAAALYAGPSVIISFVVAGIVAILSALSYSEMASMMSTPGSAYTYTYIALGEYPAFIIGWTSTLLYQLGASVVAVRWSTYVVHFIGIISDLNSTQTFVHAPVDWSEATESFVVTGHAINLPSVAITICITVLLFLGIRETAIATLGLVIFKVIVLLIFIIAGCFYVDRNHYKPFFPPNKGSFNQYGVTGMLQASTFVFFAYVGFESVSTVTREAKSPSRYIPYATIISLIITMALYLGICTVMVGLVSYPALNAESPLHEAILATPYGLWLAIVLDLGAIASLTTVAIIVLLAQTRIFYTMARDGLLPRVFARIHEARRTPWVTTIICGVICAVLSGIFPVDIRGDVASMGALITFFLVHISVIVMRYTHKHMPRDFRVPFGSWLVPSIGALSCILLLTRMSRGTGVRYGVWMAVGHIVYFSYGFWYSKARQENMARSVVNFGELTPQTNVSAIDLSEEQPSTPTADEPNETQS